VDTGPWNLNVPDASGKLHRGTFSWGDDVPPAVQPRKVFHIALRRSPEPCDAPPGVAVCIPRLTKASARPVDPPLPDVIEVMIFRESLVLPESQHAQYRAGSVLTSLGSIDPALIFTQRGRVDLIRLALVLVEQSAAERVAPYTALIRQELALPPGADALSALRLRLQPADAASKPPASAPAIKRLARVLAALDSGRAPRVALERLAEDLRFLALFEAPDKAMKREALDRLLADVVAPETSKRPARRRKPARIIQLPRREDA
jgi:hypothetical protein